MDFIKRLTLTALLLCLLALSGCGGIGPRTVVHDRFDYSSAIADSWKDQMLLNMVKMRYGDAPVFLDVASVISQYQIAGQLNSNFSWSFPPKGDSQGVGGVAQYAERPTITYSPLSGEKFTRSLITPIPPTSLVTLIQAGYPIDFVFRLCIHSINGIRNKFGGSGRARSADSEFYPLLERMRKVQDAEGIGLRMKKVDQETAVVMIFRQKVDPAIEADILANRKILGLDPQAQEYRVVYGNVPSDDKEIAILTRSLSEILVDLASLIEVPEKHVTEKRVNQTMVEQMVSGMPVRPLIQIHSSHEKPADAFVVVRYRDYWFWIDDRDLPSKRMLAFIMIVMGLVETGGKEGAPIVTIPAG